MTKAVDTDIFAGKTGRDWQEWLVFFEDIGAPALSHAEIAARIVKTGDASSWWAQSLAVAYEQHIGRRLPGQRSDGSHETSVTKTVQGSLDEALDLWRQRLETLEAEGAIGFAEPASESRSDNWRYWRRPLADGTRLSVTIGEKPNGKSTIAVTHARLVDAEDVVQWRAYWKAAISGLAD